MTTTDKFQQIQDYFDNEVDAKNSIKMRFQTNTRYKGFRQTHFTAGDVDQFNTYRDSTNGDLCKRVIKNENNVFTPTSTSTFMTNLSYEKYSSLTPTSVDNTFNYIFHKFKKGIFIKIKDNKLAVFLPFSKPMYKNEWGDRIKFNPKYGSMENYLKMVAKQTNYPIAGINKFTNSWGGNNCLMRYEFPLKEGDSGSSNMKDMFIELCKHRELPDIELFINRRDFPLLKKDSTEPYDHIFDSESYPLLSHNYEKYCPIMGCCTTDDFADICIPTWDDWQRTNTHKYFPKTPHPGHDEYPEILKETDLLLSDDSLFLQKWNKKKPTAVFRGSSTGCGVTTEDNPRLMVAKMNQYNYNDNDGLGPLLDAGITTWNTRPRKLKGKKYLDNIDIKVQPPLINRLSHKEQKENYKYVINIDGNVTAYRLSNELSFGSVILLVESNYYIWFMKLLKPYVHYIPVKKDLSDLLEKIRWCRENDDACIKIVKNSLRFYRKYLTREGIFDYMQNLFIQTKKKTGSYFYNSTTPLYLQIKDEYNSIDTYSSFSVKNKNYKHINTFPPQERSYSLMKGLEMSFDLLKDTYDNGNLDNYFIVNKDTTFISQKTKIQKSQLARYPIVIKKFVSQDDSLKYEDKENIHELFVAKNCTNNLLKFCPNFAYILGHYKDENDNLTTLVENIEGITFLDYIKSNDFNIDEYLFILIQIFLALEIAQKNYGFVHWDCMPWNIVIKELNYKKYYEYTLSHNKVVRIKTNKVPILIDYGKSHFINSGKHHGIIDMFKTSKVQDVVSIIFSTISEILTKNLENNEKRKIFLLMEKFSNTKFYPKSFKGLRDIHMFVNNMKKFSILTTFDKMDLENFSPIDFVYHIYNYQKNYLSDSISFKTSKKYNLDIGNYRQVFDFITSNNNKDRIKSYTDVFLRIKQCTIPQPKNLLFLYYTVQSFEIQLTSTYYIMENFLNIIKIPSDTHKSLYEESTRYLNYVYDSKLKNTQTSQITYIKNTHKEFNLIERCPYSENTFLDPQKIYNILQNYNPKMKDIEKLIDLSFYKTIIENILTYSGPHKMSSEHKIYYTDVFNDLLSTDKLILLNNIANIVSLKSFTKNIFTLDSNSIKVIKDIKDINSCQDYTTLKNRLNILNKTLQLV